LFRAVWARGQDVADPAVVARLASGAGLAGPQAVENAGDEAIKRRLRRNTEEAISAGAFGVPTMLVDGELFWGFDDFPVLDRCLSGEEPPFEPERVARWHAVQASADRRGSS
jgi:2-hydroxychromene-2-carboxylate isomerase